MGVKEDFEAVTEEIEKYLGILKGNETGGVTTACP